MSEGTDAPLRAGIPMGRGRFLLRRQLGEGGMAVVYEAYDCEREHLVALKVMLPELADKPALRMRFEKEAAVMRTLEHRNIVTTLDVGVADDLPFISMELVDGGTLQDWLEANGPMPPRMAVDAVVQTSRGVLAAHKLGVIHRDLKPQNILVTRRGRCKVTDFGIAQVQGDRNMTRTGASMGTLGFMAPEQRADAKGVDERADVYSLAATLFALLTDAPVLDLFLAEHETDMLAGVPDELAPVILRATAYQRERRMPSVAEFARLVHTAGRDLPRAADGTPALGSVRPTREPEETGDKLGTRIGVGPVQGPSSDPDSTPDRAVLPYTMPKVTHEGAPFRETYGKADTSPPDYVDSASLSDEPRGGYLVELDDASREATEETRQRMAERGEAPTHAPAPEMPGGAPDERIVRLTPILRALGALSAMLLVGAVALGVGLDRAAKGVIESAEAVQVERQDMYSTVLADARIVEDLAGLGGDRDELADLYLQYAEEKDPERKHANAVRYLEAVDREAERILGPRLTREGETSLEVQRIRELRRKRDVCEAADALARRRATSLPGRMAAALGLVE